MTVFAEAARIYLLTFNVCLITVAVYLALSFTITATAHPVDFTTRFLSFGIMTSITLIVFAIFGCIIGASDKSRAAILVAYSVFATLLFTVFLVVASWTSYHLPELRRSAEGDSRVTPTFERVRSDFYGLYDGGGCIGGGRPIGVSKFTDVVCKDLVTQDTMNDLLNATQRRTMEEWKACAVQSARSAAAEVVGVWRDVEYRLKKREKIGLKLSLITSNT
ncbi:hypothetical protein FOZ63_031755 [Perkinsus olseni]|uniref:Uncharacterized protein n=1 Tax=Perkinsus olseni TaxID=32597 RepID=A0A7J6RJW6_PEROL|nr:hypothetical protein FOZ63_031755 [Perkinsus olseni]KAF4751902.1 hypothetical protein FOZ62_005614 [Perkinsus olseni]